MLIEFSVENYLSFKNKVTFSMVASKDSSLPHNVIFSAQGTDLNLLKSAVVYGANASGKSNFIRAMMFMRSFVLRSAGKIDKEVVINSKQFKLDENCSKKPSEFEVVFLLDGIRYMYGFKIDSKSVVEEWLYYYPKGQQSLLFERSSNSGDIDRDFKFGSMFRGEKKSLAQKTKKHFLFISVAAQFNNKIAGIVANWFDECFKSVENDRSLIPERMFTIQNALGDKKLKKAFLDFMKVADDIKDFEIETIQRDEKLVSAVREMLEKIIPQEERPEGFDKDTGEGFSVSLVHRTRKASGNSGLISFKLDEESDGTQKLFCLAGPWFFVLSKGCLMIIDEFDTHLHPLLAENLVNMFNSDAVNNKNAQLIITTHNTDLLDKNIFRRDQIWFAEKNHDTGSSSLYSLWDIKQRKARKTDNLRKNYLSGRYGAIPILSRFDK